MRQLLSLACVLVVLSDGDLVRLFRLALRVAGCEEKAAYTDMGISQSQFSKQMAGVEPPRFLSRIWMIQNREVAKCFFFEGCALIGTPAHVKRGLPVILAQMAHKRIDRQLKMPLPTHKTEKRTA